VAWFIGQSAVMILLAFLLGILVGWLIWGRRLRPLLIEVRVLREYRADCLARHGDAVHKGESAPDADDKVSSSAGSVGVLTASTSDTAGSGRAAASGRAGAPGGAAAAASGPSADAAAGLDRRNADAATGDAGATDAATDGTAGDDAAGDATAEIAPAPRIPAPRAEVADPADLDAAARADGTSTVDDDADASSDADTVAVAGAAGLASASTDADVSADGDAATGTGGSAAQLPPADDLVRIEGIGPRISTALVAAGIRTYAQLADAPQERQRAAITAAGITFAPSIVSWSEQARLLADGREEEFAVLTARLIAGRHADDDLERIEGIGPQMSAALKSAGIRTYRSLAASSDARLRSAISEHGLTFAPSIVTWSRQAQLLADGDEEGFADLTRRLVAGRDEGRA